MTGRHLLALGLLAGLAACDRPPAASAPATASKAAASSASSASDLVYEPPNDSEAARRQANCDQAGQLALRHASLDTAITQSASATYNPRTNLCRVELQARPTDPARALDDITRTLYDGDTGQLLGTTKVEGKRRSALILETGVTDFDEASLYIDRQMSRQ